MKLLHIIGARPQFIKYFPIQRAIDNASSQKGLLKSILVHTGQHYDYQMSQVFFDELGIRPPDYHLDAGSGNHGHQTALILQKSEDVLLKEKPDIVVVYGDTNSTLGGALTAAKLHIPVAHIEAGLRSYNKKMPEEINRVLTDHISSYLFCPSQVAVDNLAAEGITPDTVVRSAKSEQSDTRSAGRTIPEAKQSGTLLVPDVSVVGDVMYDVLLHAMHIAEKKSDILHRLSIRTKEYHLLTLHRAENTDEPKRLNDIITFVNEISSQRTVIFPMHPRMVKAYAKAENHFSKNIHIIEPLSYFDLIIALKNAQRLLTDSGGMQKEAYWLHVPCITLRDQTEWVETIQSGWNVLWHNYPQGHDQRQDTHAYGDGHAAEKIISALRVRR